jgi:hypothetical protein
MPLDVGWLGPTTMKTTTTFNQQYKRAAACARELHDCMLILPGEARARLSQPPR